METVNQIWKEWYKKQKKGFGDFENLWCYLAGMIGSKELSKEQAKDIRKYLYRRTTN